MPRRRVFYSFHFDYDVMRVQLIRNIGAIEENKPVTANQWEIIKRAGDLAIKRWINQNMANCSCLVVLVGQETANRYWVQYEIEKAWNDGKGLLGIYIHNLKCARNGYCYKGSNPFENFTLRDGRKLSSIVKCYNPNSNNAYNDIRYNIEDWIDEAINIRRFT